MELDTVSEATDGATPAAVQEQQPGQAAVSEAPPVGAVDVQEPAAPAPLWSDPAMQAEIDRRAHALLMSQLPAVEARAKQIGRSEGEREREASAERQRFAEMDDEEYGRHLREQQQQAALAEKYRQQNYESWWRDSLGVLFPPDLQQSMGTEHWQRVYGARDFGELTNVRDQIVVERELAQRMPAALEARLSAQRAHQVNGSDPAIGGMEPQPEKFLEDYSDEINNLPPGQDRRQALITFQRKLASGGLRRRSG